MCQELRKGSSLLSFVCPRMGARRYLPHPSDTTTSAKLVPEVMRLKYGPHYRKISLSVDQWEFGILYAAIDFGVIRSCWLRCSAGGLVGVLTTDIRQPSLAVTCSWASTLSRTLQLEDVDLMYSTRLMTTPLVSLMRG